MILFNLQPLFCIALAEPPHERGIHFLGQSTKSDMTNGTSIMSDQEHIAKLADPPALPTQHSRQRCSAPLLLSGGEPRPQVSFASIASPLQPNQRRPEAKIGRGSVGRRHDQTPITQAAPVSNRRAAATEMDSE